MSTDATLAVLAHVLELSRAALENADVPDHEAELHDDLFALLAALHGLTCRYRAALARQLDDLPF